MGSNGNEYNSTGYMIYSEDVDPTKQLNDRPGSTQSTYQQPQPPANNYQQPAQNNGKHHRRHIQLNSQLRDINQEHFRRKIL